MRLATAFVLLLTLSLVSRADDLVTRDGQIYRDYRVIGYNAGYITITHHDGGGKVELRELPDDLQKEYGYDPIKAEAFVEKTVELEREQRQEVAQAEIAPSTSTTADNSPTSPANPPVSGDDALRDTSPASLRDEVSRDNPTLDAGTDPLQPGAEMIHMEGDGDSQELVHTVSADGGYTLDGGGYFGGGWVTYQDLQGNLHREFRQRGELHLGPGEWVYYRDPDGQKQREFRQDDHHFAGSHDRPDLVRVDLPHPYPSALPNPNFHDGVGNSQHSLDSASHPSSSGAPVPVVRSVPHPSAPTVVTYSSSSSSSSSYHH